MQIAIAFRSLRRAYGVVRPRAPAVAFLFSGAKRKEETDGASRSCCESDCDRHAVQRSLYRHALNALLLASRSGCDSKDALALAQQCAEMMRAADEREALSAAAQR